jgi:TP901 family phage tail tape measure protein
LASSGAFRVEQFAINDVVSKQTELLTKQKLAFRDVFGKKSRTMMKAIYRDQLAMREASFRLNESLLSNGKAMGSLAVPTNVHKSWDTLSSRVGFFSQRLHSASTGLLNWGKNTQWAGRQLMAGLTMPIALFGAAAGVMAYKTDAALASIVKVYDFTAKATQNAAEREKEANQLRTDSLNNAAKAARQYGADIMDTLDVEQKLAATGLSGSRLFSTTNEVQRISRLGDIDPSQTTEMVVALQTAFKDTIRDGKDLTDTLNFMNAASNATSLSLQDIAEATPRAATAIAQLGGTAKEMTVLLVSMREAGIKAAEGANALKSASTRIINPVKKATEFYKQYGISLEHLAEVSGGNIYQYLQLLGEEQQKIQGPTEKQTKLLRAQGVAALFGTYQNNRLTASLVNMTDALSGNEDGANQTRKAMELMGMSSEAMSKQAAASMRDITESASGKFRQSWQSLRAELTKIGKPFLEVASVFTKLAVGMMKFFNSMPGWSKKIVIFGLIVGALVGPIIMLVGLFANFAANIGRFGAFLLGLTSDFKVYTRSQWIAMQAAKQAETQMVQQTTIMEEMKAQLIALTAANKEYAESMRMAAGIRMPVSSKVPTFGPSPVPLGPNMPNSVLANNLLTSWQDKTGRYRDPNNRMIVMPKETAALRANEAVSAQIAKNEQAALAAREQSVIAQKQAAEAAGQTAVNAQKTAKNLASGAIFGGTMAASMILMSGAAGDTGAEIGKWLMIGSMVVPAINAMNKAWAASRAAAIATAAATTEAAIAEGVLAAETGVAAGFAWDFAAAMKTAFGPVTWIVAGVAAVGFAIKKIFDANKKQAEEQKRLYDAQMKANDALAKSSSSIATSLGKAAGHYEQLAAVGQGASGIGPNEDYLTQRYRYYKTDEAGKQETSAFMNRSTGALYQDDMLINKVNQKFIDLQVIGRDTAEQAKKDLQAMLLAAGYSAQEAEGMVEDVYNRLGDISKIDWAKPLANQLDMINNAVPDSLVGGPKVYVGPQANAKPQYSVGELDSQAIEQLRANADKAVEVFNMALSNAANPQEEAKIIKQMMDGALREWNRGFQTIMDSSDTAGRQLLEKYQIKSGEQFASAWRNNADFRKEYTDLAKFHSVLTNVTTDASVWERTFTGRMSKGMDALGDDVDTVSKALAELRAQGFGLDPRQAAGAILSTSLGTEIGNLFSFDPSKILSNQESDLTSALNRINRKMHFEQGKDSVTALNNLLNETKDTTNSVADAAEKATKVLDGMAFSAEQAIQVRKAGMESVQSALADMISSNFEKQMQNAIDNNTSYWDNAVQKLQDQQQNASDRLDNQQENQTNRFEKRWDRRKQAVSDAYDQRIKDVEKAIKAEQKAEEIRQKIFEAEQTRLDRLTESANRTIDFNMALQTGQLDEAAKIRNDMDAAAQQWALSDAAGAGASASQRRQNRLQNRADRIGRHKDAALKALDAREEAERKSLERRQEMEKKHLEKVQKMNMDALEAQAKAAEDAFQNEWDARKDSLDGQLDLFKSFVPKNQKQLRDWMDEMNIDYDHFGLNVLKPKSKEWGDFFNTNLQKGIRAAGTSIANDNMWTKLGKRSANKTLEAMGFNSLKKFAKFIETGKLPDDFGKPKQHKGNVTASGPRPGNSTFGPQEGLHSGGMVGQGTNSRQGIARSIKGLHPAEAMVRALKGEFIVNRDASKKHSGLLSAINSGVLDSARGNILGGAPGTVGLIGAMIPGFASGVAQALKNAYRDRKSGANGVGVGSYVPGPGGRSRPIRGYGYGGLHDQWTGYSAVDFAAPTGTPVFAVGNGTISRSYDIPGPLPSDSYRGDGPYGSYGRVIYLKLDSGPEVLYAHLSRRNVVQGQRVTGGSVIGESGNTGNSSGPHLHFGSQVPPGPLAFLKKGGMTLNDGMAMLHRGETVLTQDLTNDLKDTVRAFGKTSRDVLSGKSKIDPNPDTGNWTYLSGWTNAVDTISKANTAKTVSAPSDGSIRSGTFNMGTRSNEGSIKDLSKLMGLVDVLSLNEMSSKHRALIPWIESQGWGFYGKRPGTALMWNKKNYSMTGAGEVPLAPAGGGISGHRYATYGKFSGPGGKFYQISAHTIAWPYKNKTRRHTELTEFESLRQLWGNLHKDGTPVILGGDMNESIKRGDWIKRIGLGIGTHSGPGTHGNDYLDHLFSVGLTPGEHQVIKGLTSDHNALINTFNIPSHKSGAENIRWDNTLVNMHKKESILTAAQSDKFRSLADNIDNVAGGAGNQYNITVQVSDTNASADDIAKKVLTTIKKAEMRKPQRRRS